MGEPRRLPGRDRDALPLLLAYPDALIYELDQEGVHAVSYEATSTVRIYREFLSAPGAFVASLTKARDGSDDEVK